MNAHLSISWLPVLALCMMRPLGVFLLLPVFTSATLGGSLIRNALILIIAIPAVPAYLELPILSTTIDIWAFAWLLMGEVAIGAMLGFIAAIPFWAIDMAGFVVDTLRGSSMASIFNPTLNVQSSLFGMLFSQILSTLFLVTGGFNKLIESIYQSLVLLPPGAPFYFHKSFIPFCTHAWQILFELCLNFAMPAIVVMVLIDLSLGLINRSAKQLNVFFVAMPIKCLLALLLFVASLNFAFGDYLSRIENFTDQAHGLITTLIEPRTPTRSTAEK